MSDWTKYWLGIVSFLFCAAVIAVWKLIGGKVDKSTLESLVKERDLSLTKALEAVSGEIKAVNSRLDSTLVQIAQSVTKTDLIERLATASTRVADNDLRVQRDIAEQKMDLKTLVDKVGAVERVLTEKVTMVDKKLDELPSRVASLEQTRNQRQP
jgi:hypothetical protein